MNLKQKFVFYMKADKEAQRQLSAVDRKQNLPKRIKLNDRLKTCLRRTRQKGEQ